MLAAWLAGLVRCLTRAAACSLTSRSSVELMTGFPHDKLGVILQGTVKKDLTEVINQDAISPWSRDGFAAKGVRSRLHGD